MVHHDEPIQQQVLWAQTQQRQEAIWMCMKVDAQKTLHDQMFSAQDLEVVRQEMWLLLLNLLVERENTQNCFPPTGQIQLGIIIYFITLDHIF